MHFINSLKKVLFKICVFWPVESKSDVNFRRSSIDIINNPEFFFFFESSEFSFHSRQ